MHENAQRIFAWASAPRLHAQMWWQREHATKRCAQRVFVAHVNAWYVCFVNTLFINTLHLRTRYDPTLESASHTLISTPPTRRWFWILLVWTSFESQGSPPSYPYHALTNTGSYHMLTHFHLTPTNLFRSGRIETDRVARGGRVCPVEEIQRKFRYAGHNRRPPVLIAP